MTRRTNMLTLFWSGRTNRRIHFGVFTSEGIYKKYIIAFYIYCVFTIILLLERGETFL